MADKPLIVGTGLRGIVQRLLRGEARPGELNELFYYMRQESGGSGLVSEIANFRGHPTRSQGIVWHEVRDYFVFVKFRESLQRRRIFTVDFPASMPEAMRANLRRMRKSILLRETGLNRTDAEKVLERILARSLNIAGGVRIGALSAEETNVFLCVANNLKGGPLFSDNDLFEDLCRALINQGLLQPSEKLALRKSKPAVSLFALTEMHNKTIDLGDGGIAKLSITSDRRKRLAIYASSEVIKDRGNGRLLAMATWIFETGCQLQITATPASPLPKGVYLLGTLN
jgi:hypothetical protein